MVSGGVQRVSLRPSRGRSGHDEAGDRPFPYDGSCDVDVLQTTYGWSPSPLLEFVLKVETRCNLNCDYCYVYNMGDESWRDQPAAMSLDVVDALAARIRDHAVRHGLTRVLISLHGGEPLLRGVERAEAIVARIRKQLPGLDVKFSMQTNAVRVDERVADRLAMLDVGVGVSIDGPDGANGHRLDVHGGGSVDRAVEGIRALARRPGLLSGVLCVIDLNNDPVEVFDFLTTLGSPSIDFLLPHGNWMTRPPGKQVAAKSNLTSPAPYGDWLITVFDRWFNGQHRKMKVRLFNDLIHLILGGESTYEAVGLSPAQLVVIEADGSIELVDHIGPSYPGSELTGASVFTTDLDEVLKHPGVVCRQIGVQALHGECRSCTHGTVCGAGLITHRWDNVGGFRNPTVFCSDMAILIDHIRASLEAHLSSLVRR